ncbi:DUF6318 domain-containing protein [Occultella aeris]|uniref:DUF6318 domain-containing protein n=1 Tax=Occultella aeris TaxID=2761496 RepID=A0A7M4DNG1_9MICO|nr:DUF6318 family protein [Occultella aeris]VZO38974.1 hypothetical protein HALOF300_03691 [Occultella aeris]
MPSNPSARIHRSVASVVALAALVLVPGCDGSPSGSQASTEPEAGGATIVAQADERQKNTLEGVAPPVRPAAMDDPGPEGAVAAAAYFISLFPYLFTSGDLHEWEALATADCAVCTQIADGAAALHTEGGRNSGGDFEVLHALTSGQDGADGRYIVQLDVVEGPSIRIAGDGSQVEQANGRYPELWVSVVRDAGSWRVDGVSFGSGPFATPMAEPPADLDDAGRAGAVAAAANFFLTYSDAHLTREVAALEAISGPDCAFCTGAIASVNDLLAQESTLAGGTASVETAGADVEQVDGTYRVTIDVVEGGRTITHADGTAASAPSSVHAGIVVTTQFLDGTWVILEVELP